MSGANKRLRVVHVSPTYFSPDSFVGGGERFVEELARAMDESADVKLVAFGPHSRRRPLGSRGEHVVLRNRTRHKMTPFSPWLMEELRDADVIHCHQFFTLSTFLAAWIGRVQGSRVFVTDLGGGGWTPGYQIDVTRWIERHLPISRYAARGIPGENPRFTIIGAGVDPDRFSFRQRPEHDGSLVFLGRVFPHKGLHVLIEALPPDRLLHVIGPAYDSAYLRRLQHAALGKMVQFHHGLADEAVIDRLQRAMALVHPTPVDKDGNAGANELFGLALVEAMACGCPVIASRAASLPEIVDDGVTGMLVEPSDPDALRRAILRMEKTPRWVDFSLAARQRVLDRFTWKRTAETALLAYGDAPSR